MSQKGSTYFIILVFLFAAGAVFSNSLLDTRSAGKAVSVFQKAAGMILPDFSMDERTNPQSKAKIISEYQITALEIRSNYSHKNDLLSVNHFNGRENARRTNNWFTSRLKS